MNSRLPMELYVAGIGLNATRCLCHSCISPWFLFFVPVKAEHLRAADLIIPLVNRT